MRLTVVSCQQQAIKLGRNTTQWSTDIDIASLNTAQRKFLAEQAGEGAGGGEEYSASNPIVDPTGEITAASIQAAIDAETARNDELRRECNARIDQELAKLVKSVTEYENGGKDVPFFSPSGLRAQAYANVATPGYGEDGYAALRTRAKAETDRRHALELSNNEMALETDEAAVAAYENGGKRPPVLVSGNFPEHSNRKESILRHLASEDKRRERTEYEKTTVQLTAAVLEFGTSIQAERWAAGFMPRAEAIDLIWSAATKPIQDAGLVICKYDGCGILGTAKLPSHEPCESCEDSAEISDKRTLTDPEWERAKTLKSVLPERARVRYLIETVSCPDHGERKLVFAECNWFIDNVEIVVAVVLSLL